MRSDIEEFRNEVQSWLEINCPPLMRTPPDSGEEVWGGRNPEFRSEEARVWMQRMGEKGWTAPMWPKKYGGGGLSRQENTILNEELRRISARKPLLSFGLWMIGPTLLEYGTEAQKQEFLPKMIRGEIRWCQGYTEPGAGSDLAGLQTKAVEDGDEYVINGQKVWTSYADKSDWMFALVRTDTTVKHAGISMVVFDMESPGVSTRPIRLISGGSNFCEIFLDDVRVPKSNVIGGVNNGWEVSNRLLQFERENVSGDFFADEKSDTLVTLAKKYIGEDQGAISDPLARIRLAKLSMRERSLKLTVKRIMESARLDSSTGAASSILKFVSAELNKDRADFAVDAVGQSGLGWEGDEFLFDELVVTREWLRSKGNSIEGGTTEINLHVIAKRILGLGQNG